MSDEEVAYRRGFQQGAETLLSFVERHLPSGTREIAQGYVKLKLMEWRYGAADSSPPPPIV